jgi:hypothetical protein
MLFSYGPPPIVVYTSGNPVQFPASVGSTMIREDDLRTFQKRERIMAEPLLSLPNSDAFFKV